MPDRLKPDANLVLLPLRQRILALSEERFLSFGFSTITMDDLASELAISKKTLYQHFTSKEQLLDAMLENRMERIHAEFQKIVETPMDDFSEKLALFLSHMTRRLGELKPPFLHDMKRHAPGSFCKVEQFRDRHLPIFFNQMIQEGVNSGMIRTDINVRFLIESLQILVKALINPENMLRLNMPVNEAFAEIINTLFRGVTTEKGRQIYESNEHRWNIPHI